MNVFEDFARRAIEFCVFSLKTGAEKVKRGHAAIHGDLFLVRHLLILREQLVPFEIRLQSIEKFLDFTTTYTAYTQFLTHTTTALRFDQANGFLQFALSGIPNLNETEVDVKKNLDTMLKTACLALKESSLKMLLGPLNSFLAKVTAFIGDFNFLNPHNNNVNNNGNNKQNSRDNIEISEIENKNKNFNGSNDNDINENEIIFLDNNNNSKLSKSKISDTTTIINHHHNNNKNSITNGKNGLINNNNHHHHQSVLLTNEKKTILKNQAFARMERIKEMLENVQNILLQSAPDLKNIMKVLLF
jgi:hypothetical protein